MADELAHRVEVREPATNDGRMRDVSGVSKTTLQKEMAGDRMPTRDVVQHLLDIAVENLPDPPSPESQKALWDSYYPALEQKVPLLVSLYKAIDARDDALRALAAAEEREGQLRRELGQQKAQAQVMRTGLERVRSNIERAEEIGSIRTPRGWSDSYGERLLSLSQTVWGQSQHLEVLTSELDDLRGQSKRAVWRALRVIRRAQGKREQELTAEIVSLRAERDALLRLLERAQREAEDTRRQARNLSNDLRDGLLSPWSRPDAFEELQKRVEFSDTWREQLDDQLTRSHEGLEAARAEATRQDAHLAQLLQEQSNRIARLRERAVLSEADNVLAAALDQLSR
ncbi:hypothetical protein [Streptomyces sp. NPDC058108]|uniref:hypothetical protein n=1 Tax=Streptomyces sp. NPDC058108 TaxID=3346344 RepID=UPI0036ECFF6C